MKRLPYEQCKECDIYDGTANRCFSECYKPIEALEELRKYKYLEEQGLLRRLPCKPGDTIYVIPSKVNFELNIINQYEKNNRVYAQTVDKVTFYPSGEYLLTTCEGVCSALQQFFGITWFLTEQEAQATLDKMKDGEQNG